MAKKPMEDPKVEAPLEQMAFEQYCERYQPNLSIYTRAYVGAGVRGIMKTKDGWDQHMNTEGKK